MNEYEKWKRIVFTTGGGGFYTQFRGHSSWEKPKNANTGDELIEIDTHKVYMFVEGMWYEM